MANDFYVKTLTGGSKKSKNKNTNFHISNLHNETCADDICTTESSIVKESVIINKSGGTLTSIDVFGGSTGLIFSGGPVTKSGVITASGILSISNGGTGADNAIDAINNLLPDQTGNTSYVLTTDGSNVSWQTFSGNTDLGLLIQSGQMIITSSSGADVTLTTATITNDGLLSKEDKSYLDSLITLTGIAANNTNLGTFTGTYISDNATIKQALQELETAIGSGNLPIGAAPGDMIYFDGTTYALASPKKNIQNINSGSQITLPHVPLANTMVDVYLNGVLKEEGVDYTIASNIITFSFNFGTNDKITTKYFA